MDAVRKNMKRIGEAKNVVMVQKVVYAITWGVGENCIIYDNKAFSVEVMLLECDKIMLIQSYYKQNHAVVVI